MFRCLQDYTLRTCGLRITRQLEERGFLRTNPDVAEAIEKIFIKTHDRATLLKHYLMRMSQNQSWQIRLRYLIILVKICRKLSIYEIVTQTKLRQLLSNLEAGKSRTLLARHLQNEQSIDQKVLRHIVEPLYYYLVRIGENQQIYLKFMQHDAQHPLTQLFKLCNFLNILFELQESCRIVLSNYVNVQILEDLVEIVYEEIIQLYAHFRDTLEEAITKTELIYNFKLLELEILLKQEKLIHQKVCEFAFLFQNFTQRQVRVPPRKISIQVDKLRKLLQGQKLFGVKRQSKTKMSQKQGKDPKWILSQYIKHSVYEDQHGIIDDDGSDKGSDKKGRKWKQDSDSDGLDHTIKQLADESQTSLQKSVVSQGNSR